MLLPGDSPLGQKARNTLPLEFPNNTDPGFRQGTSRVDAMMTRDWGQVIPGRKPGYQAGFIVMKPNVTVFEDVLRVIRETEYDGGFSRQNGWGAKGYGGFVGAAAMQGLMAYYYDEVAPKTWIELNQCRFNHMGMDILYRANPNFFARYTDNIGKCRNTRPSCEDCQVTPLSDIYSIHYTQCRKPWTCTGEGSSTRSTDKTAMPEDNVIVSHCLELATVWHTYRREIEEKLGFHNFSTGTYMPDVFQGHCNGYGGRGYISFTDNAELRQRIPKLYGE
jgi:hypothetical protein